MKTLYYGGQKSGKSSLAEAKALELADQNRPVYIATYDDSYGDAEMAERIARHRAERAGRFVSVEEPRDLIGQIVSSALITFQLVGAYPCVFPGGAHYQNGLGFQPHKQEKI